MESVNIIYKIEYTYLNDRIDTRITNEFVYKDVDKAWTKLHKLKTNNTDSMVEYGMQVMILND